MKYLKLILPMMAMIFAIGLMFATVNPETEPNIPESDNYAAMYVNVNNTWHQIDVDCETGNRDCLVIFSDDPSGTPYQVYNSPSLNDKALGSRTIKKIEGPVPSI